MSEVHISQSNNSVAMVTKGRRSLSLRSKRELNLCLGFQSPPESEAGNRSSSHYGDHKPRICKKPHSKSGQQELLQQGKNTTDAVDSHITES